MNRNKQESASTQQAQYAVFHTAYFIIECVNIQQSGNHKDYAIVPQLMDRIYRRSKRLSLYAYRQISKYKAYCEWFALSAYYIYIYVWMPERFNMGDH